MSFPSPSKQIPPNFPILTQAAWTKTHTGTFSTPTSSISSWRHRQKRLPRTRHQAGKGQGTPEQRGRHQQDRRRSVPEQGRRPAPSTERSATMKTMPVTGSATTAWTAGEQGRTPPPLRRTAQTIADYADHWSVGRSPLDGERRLEEDARRRLRRNTRMSTTAPTTVSPDAGTRDE